MNQTFEHDEIKIEGHCEGYVSEHANLDNYDSTDSNNEDGRRKKTVFPMFDFKTNMYKMEPLLNMKFSNSLQLKQFLADYSITKRFPVKLKGNAKRRLTVICADGCPWRLHASYTQNEDTCQIKSLNRVHKCVRNFKIKMANSKWLANMYFKKITQNLW